MTKNIELLAPAGNAAALRAAVSAGADAVYLGLESFNARRGADNFTVRTFEEACAYAHLRGVRVYVTMNTAVLPAEVDEALECARQAYRAGADAFIVQDIGLASEISRTLPEVRLHISTQMNTHNEAGLRAAARLGASRVTLARELSLEEIAHLSEVAASLGMEVEAFAHGALCVCYSGQCFMSSLIGGRSANRGMCAQACRLPYELRNASLRSKSLPSPGEHLLSPRDLCSIDLLSELVDGGVSSLKIEGRMKSPDYVYSVVSVYRAVLDRVLAACDADGVEAERVSATDEEREKLASAFSRGFTTAYLEGERGNDIMSYQRPNNRGQFVGRVAEVKRGEAKIATETEIVVGDVIEFWTKRGHTALTVTAVAAAKGGAAVSVPLDEKTRGVRAGDRVFRVRSVAAAFSEGELEPRVPLVGKATLRIGSPLRIEFALAGAGACSDAADARIAARLERLFDGRAPHGIAEGDAIEAARTRPVAADDVYAHVDRLGSTPFTLVGFDVDLDEGVGIGFSQIHRCRAEALDALEQRMLAGMSERSLPRIADDRVVYERPRASCVVAAWASNPVCARAAKRAGAEVVYVPALNFRRGEAVIAGQLMGRADQAGFPKHCTPALPVVDHEAIGRSREHAVDVDVWRYVSAGSPVLVENLAGLQRAAEEDALPEVGPHVPATNKLSLAAVRELGARRVWLSPELTLSQIRELGQDSPVVLGLTVIGAQELMTTEHCLLMSQGPCDQQCSTCPRRKSPHYLKDRKGFEFPVVTDLLGRSHLYNSVQLDIVPAIPDLIAAGVTSFMVDTTLMNGEEAASAVERVVRAVKVAQLDGNTLAKMPDTTSGHLYRGVS